MTLTENGTSRTLVDRLRSQAERYHAAHPFHVRMNDGRALARQIEGWVANRFAYQEAIPIKDAAILSNCPDVAVRRRWIRRITDHDGTADGEGRHRGLGAPRRGVRGAARGDARPPPRRARRALRRRRLRDLRAHEAVGDRRGLVAHRAVRPRPHGRPGSRRSRSTTRGSTPRACSTSATGSSRPRGTPSTPSRWCSSTAGPRRRAAGRVRRAGVQERRPLEHDGRHRPRVPGMTVATEIDATAIPRLGRGVKLRYDRSPRPHRPAPARDRGRPQRDRDRHPGALRRGRGRWPTSSPPCGNATATSPRTRCTPTWPASSPAATWR